MTTLAHVGEKNELDIFFENRGEFYSIESIYKGFVSAIPYGAELDLYKLIIFPDMYKVTDGYNLHAPVNTFLNAIYDFCIESVMKERYYKELDDFHELHLEIQEQIDYEAQTMLVQTTKYFIEYVANKWAERGYSFYFDGSQINGIQQEVW